MAIPQGNAKGDCEAQDNQDEMVYAKDREARTSLTKKYWSGLAEDDLAGFSRIVLAGGIIGINVFVVLLTGMVSGSVIMLATASPTAAPKASRRVNSS